MGNNSGIKKIGLLGGSFNPPHQGHLHISDLALKNLKLDEIWWIPTLKNPLKDEKIYENYQIRLEKCQLLIENQPKIKIRAFDEIYTIELIEKLQKNHKNIDFFWIMGADNLKNMHLWKNFEKLIELIPFAIFSRENHLENVNKTEAFKIMDKNLKCHLMIFESENYDISSTQIRGNLNV